MYQTHKTYLSPEQKLSGLIHENPGMLLLLEHLGIDFVVGDLSVSRLCEREGISLPLFMLLGNLYNGLSSTNLSVSRDDIPVIIRFLRSSHQYYKTDKYPEIIGYIRQLQEQTASHEVKLIESFFLDYFNEVLEHLDYEESTAFPYFLSFTPNSNPTTNSNFSANEYREHHSDIETKLTDLKTLLLKHIRIPNQLSLRRKLLNSLFELESDLHVHAMVEENILMPLISELERADSNG